MADDGDQVGWDGVKPDRMGQLEAKWAGWKGRREGGGRRRGRSCSGTQPTRPPKETHTQSLQYKCTKRVSKLKLKLCEN